MPTSSAGPNRGGESGESSESNGSSFHSLDTSRVATIRSVKAWHLGDQGSDAACTQIDYFSTYLALLCILPYAQKESMELLHSAALGRRGALFRPRRPMTIPILGHGVLAPATALECLSI